MKTNKNRDTKVQTKTQTIGEFHFDTSPWKDEPLSIIPLPKKKRGEKRNDWSLDDPNRPLNPWEPGGDEYRKYLKNKLRENSLKKPS